MRRCSWCRGRGFIKINGIKKDCLNCHGLGYGKDGGRIKRKEGSREYLVGNKFRKGKKKHDQITV